MLLAKLEAHLAGGLTAGAELGNDEASAMSHCVSSGFFGNCRRRTESCR